MEKEISYQPTKEEMQKAEETMTDEQKRQSKMREEEFTKTKDGLPSTHIEWEAGAEHSYFLRISEEDEKILSGLGFYHYSYHDKDGNFVPGRTGYVALQEDDRPDHALERLKPAIRYYDGEIERSQKTVKFFRDKIHEEQRGSNDEKLISKWNQDLKEAEDKAELWKIRRDKVHFMKEKIIEANKHWGKERLEEVFEKKGMPHYKKEAYKPTGKEEFEAEKMMTDEQKEMTKKRRHEFYDAEKATTENVDAAEAEINKRYGLAPQLLGDDFVAPERLGIALGQEYTAEQIKNFTESLPSNEVLEWCKKNDYALIAGPPQKMTISEIIQKYPNLFWGDELPSDSFATEGCYVDENWLMIAKRGWSDREGEKNRDLDSSEFTTDAAEVVWAQVASKITRGHFSLDEGRERVYLRTSSRKDSGSDVVVGTRSEIENSPNVSASSERKIYLTSADRNHKRVKMYYRVEDDTYRDINLAVARK